MHKSTDRCQVDLVIEMHRSEALPDAPYTAGNLAGLYSKLSVQLNHFLSKLHAGYNLTYIVYPRMSNPALMFQPLKCPSAHLTPGAQTKLII